MDIRAHVADCIDLGLSKEEIKELITSIENPELGDFTLPCFRFAKERRKSPNAIAEELSDGINNAVKNKRSIVLKTQAVNGYLNFFLDREYLAKEILNEIINAGENYGSAAIGKGKTICIDYSSINIAKTFHIGHLSTTAIGSALYKIYKFLGYNVIGINHLGDWGTQLGKLITAYKLWGSEKELNEKGVFFLQDIYVRFHKEEEADPSLTLRAREWFVKVEEGDSEATKLIDYFTELTIKEAEKLYKRLNVRFDSMQGERFYNDKMDVVIADLTKKGLLHESDGAMVVDLSGYDMPPCLIIKSDGATLYATRDLATAYYRKSVYDFDKCLYVVASHQSLHFRQFFKVLELAGFTWARDLVHVSYGMVSLQEGSMSTRAGNFVSLSSVMDMAVEKARKTIQIKSGDIENSEAIAEAVGIGAVIWSAVSNSKVKDIVFTFDRILSFEGETAPYLQYTHARAVSLIEKSADKDFLAKNAATDYSVLTDPTSSTLLKELNDFDSVLKAAAEKYEPSILSKYLINIAQLFNRFYYEFRIQGEEPKVKKARLRLVFCVKTVIKTGLSLLGIKAVDKM